MKVSRSILKVILLAIAASLFLTQGIFAQRQQPRDRDRTRRFDPAQWFDRMDENKDGKISKEEFRGPEDRFAAADADKDGFLTKEEFEKMPRPERPERAEAPGDPAQMTDRFAERIKENFGTTEEEWKAIKPLVTKVIDARMKASANFGGFRTRRGGDQPSSNPAADALSKAIEEKASADEIKAKLTAYRDQQKKNEEELKTAREALRKVLSVSQEAQLVLMGLLD